jgi:hypothetical protein
MYLRTEEAPPYSVANDPFIGFSLLHSISEYSVLGTYTTTNDSVGNEPMNHSSWPITCPCKNMLPSRKPPRKSDSSPSELTLGQTIACARNRFLHFGLYSPQWRRAGVTFPLTTCTHTGVIYCLLVHPPLKQDPETYRDPHFPKISHSRGPLHGSLSGSLAWWCRPRCRCRRRPALLLFYLGVPVAAIDRAGAIVWNW